MPTARWSSVPAKGISPTRPASIWPSSRTYVQQTAGGQRAEEEAPPETPQPDTDRLSTWLTHIHGKAFIRYEGLLALAHDQGLLELGATFVSVTGDLALAWAWARFTDGRTFWEAGDATPGNVHPQVRSHFARVALTRAKARTLRDALNIGMVAVEELGE